MVHEVQGVVTHGKGEPVSLETIHVPDPGPGEALVRVQACGVCHTDLHDREGGINDDFPFLLGHEAAGIVESVGDGVDGVAPGDFVVIAWRAPCGTCLHAPSLDCVFSGDTLFHGGPGATGRSYSDRDVLVRSVRQQLLPLPDDTVVHTGHGDDTTIGAEAPGIA